MSVHLLGFINFNEIVGIFKDKNQCTLVLWGNPSGAPPPMYENDVILVYRNMHGLHAYWIFC